MKIFTASALLSVSIISTAFSVDKAEPAPTKTPPAKPVPTEKTGQPPILTLEAPLLQAQRTPGVPDPSPNAHDAATGKPLPPGTQKVPAPAPDGGSTAPAITLNQEPAPLAPGVYMASPFTGIVVVPKLTDQPMVKMLPKTRGIMPSPAPDLKLTPKAK